MDPARQGGRPRTEGEQDAHALGPLYVKLYLEGLLDDRTLKADEKLLIALILSLSKNSRRVCFAGRNHLGRRLGYRGDYVHRIVKKINTKYEAGKTGWRIHVTYRHLAPGEQRTNLWRVLIPFPVLARWTAQRDAARSADNCPRSPAPKRAQPSAQSAQDRTRLSADTRPRNKKVLGESQIPPLWRDPTAWKVFAATAAAGGDVVAAINRGIEHREIVCFLDGIRWKAVVGARPHAFNPNLIVLDIEARNGADPTVAEERELLTREMGQWVFLSAWPKGHFPT